MSLDFTTLTTQVMLLLIVIVSLLIVIMLLLIVIMLLLLLLLLVSRPFPQEQTEHEVREAPVHMRLLLVVACHSRTHSRRSRHTATGTHNQACDYMDIAVDIFVFGCH